VYKNVYQDKSKTGVFAEQFLKGNDYEDVFTNDNFSVSSFIIANDNEKRHTKSRKIRTISVIFQINLKKVYATIPHRADEEFHNELSNALRGLKKPSELIDGINGIDNVYTEFEIAKLKEKNHDLHPLHVFRQDIEVQYDYDCCPVFANDGCTIQVTVETTTESTESSSDGTAAAITTGAQGNLTYLWNDPSEQTTQTAIGLGSGSYTVIVTDDNVLIPACTATANGVVEVAPPLPSCGIEVTEIIVVAPSAPHLSDGTATATVTGATNIGYSWSNGQTTAIATGLSVGDIALTALDLDVLGCRDTLSAPVVARWEAKCWLRADEPTSINDGSPSTDDLVEQWLDLSGCGNDALQSVIGSQFAWKDTYMQMDGSDFMDLGYVLSKIKNRSIYVVFKQDVLPALAYIYGDGNSTGTTESTGSSLVTVGAVRYQSNYGGDNNTTLRRTRGSTAPTTDIVLYSDRFTSGSGPLTTLEINGVGETETDGGGTATGIGGIPSRFSLGRLGELTALNVTGRLYEFIFFGEEVTATVNSDVTDYLKSKYSL
jgi:hypothetical protein